MCSFLHFFIIAFSVVLFIGLLMVITTLLIWTVVCIPQKGTKLYKVYQN